MWIRFIPGKFLQVLKCTPILYEYRPSQIEVEFCSKESFLRMLIKGAQHRPHGSGNGDPLTKGKKLVYTHTYQENNKWIIGLSRKSSRYHFSHVKKLLSLVYSTLHHLTVWQPHLF